MRRLLFKYRSFGFLLLVFALSIFSIRTDLRGSAIGGKVVSVTEVAVFPLQKAATSFTDAVTDALSFAAGAKGRWDYDRELEQRVVELSRVSLQFAELQAENERLRKLTDLKTRSPWRTIGGEVIGWGIGWGYTLVTIDKGETDGIEIGMPVITYSGLVGRITDISDHSSRVLLVTDSNSKVAAILQHSRALGIVEGQPGGSCQMKYIDPTVEVSVGEMAFSSGDGGVFPKGIPIGTVSKVERSKGSLFQYAVITPAAELGRLEMVLVVAGDGNDGDDAHMSTEGP